MITNSQPPTDNSYEDEIDLREILLNLWKYKILIIALSLIGAGLGVGFSIQNTKYVYTAFFLVSSDKQYNQYKQDKQDKQDKQITIDKYKVYQNVIFDGKRFEGFLKKNGKLDDETSKIFKPVFENKSAIEKIIKPEFSSVSDKDAKSLGVKVDATEKAYLMGFTFRLESAKLLGEIPLTILGDYIQNTIIQQDFEESLRVLQDQSNLSLIELRNADIRSDFEIQQQELKSDTLRKQIAKNSGSVGFDNRQLVSIEKGTERYLSPESQLVAAEILISDMRIQALERKRNLEMIQIKAKYYDLLHEGFKKSINGKDFIFGLNKYLDYAFANKDKKIEYVELVFNELDIQRQRWILAYAKEMLFAAEPSAYKESKPSKPVGLLMGLMAGGMGGCFLALFLSWWKKDSNQRSV
jgi:capsular polysaccharide biosynthesis protein